MRIVSILTAVAIVLIAGSGVGYLREFVAVDSCLDSGGSFDYMHSACDHEANHPFVAYRDRYPFFVVLIGLGVGAAATAFALRRRASQTRAAV